MLKVDRIDLEPGGEMIRAGFGRNKFRWFFRVDLWKVAYRFTRKS